MINLDRLVRHRRLFGFAVALAFLGITSMAGADPPKKTFRLAAGDASSTLREFSRQAGEQIVFPIDLVRGVQTNPVQGRFTPRAALERMVAKTELVVFEDEQTGALTVSRPPRTRVLPSEPGSSSIHPNPAPSRPMKNRIAVLLSAVAAALAPNAASAQAAAPAVPAQPAGQVVELSPFEVTADTGYVATNSMAGSRLNRPLSQTPASLSVMTSDLLEDIAASDIVEAMDYSVASQAFTPAGELPGGNINSAIFSPATVYTRGFASDITRNYFRWDIFSDAYNTERLEMSRGPNSILFGTGGVGGIINIGTKKAIIGGPSANFVEASFQVGSWDRYRATLDINRVLNDRLALRLNAVYHDAEHWVDHRTEERKAVHLAGTWRAVDKPNLGLLVQVEAEDLSQTFGNGRSMPFIDQVTGGWDGVTGVQRNQNASQIRGLTRLGGSNQYYWIPESNLLMDFRLQGVTQGPANSLHFLDQRVAPRSLNFRLGEGTWVDVRNYTALFQGRLGRNFHAEFAYNRQEQFFENLELRTTSLWRDPNLFLPNGDANPHFGEYFSQTQDQLLNRPRDTDSDEFRVTASYNLKLGEMTEWSFLGDHWFAALVNRRETEEEGSTRRFFAFNDATGARLQRVGIRRYLTGPGAGGPFTRDMEIQGNGMSARWVYQNASDRSFDQRIEEGRQLVYMGNLWKDRISLTYGVRWDSLKERGLANSAKQLSPDGRTVSFTSRSFDPYTVHFDDNRSESYGVVLRPIKQLAFTYNYSESFAPESRFKWDVTHPDPYWDMDNAWLPVGPETGYTDDYGVRFYLLEGKIQASVVRFETVLGNDFINLGGSTVSAITPAMQIARGDLSYTYGRPSTNGTFGSNSKGVEFELTANVTNHLRLRAAFSKFDTTQFDIAPELTEPMLNIYLPEWERLVSGWQRGPNETLPPGVTQPASPVVNPNLGRPLTFFEAHGDAIDSNYVARSENEVVATGAPGLHDYINQARLGLDEKSFNRENLPRVEDRSWRANLMASYDFHGTGTMLDNLSFRYGARIQTGLILDSFFDASGAPAIVQDSGIQWISDLGLRYRLKFKRYDLKLDLFVKNLFDNYTIEPVRIKGKYRYNDERNYLFTVTSRF